MIIVPVPRRFIRTTGWAQTDARKQLQRSEFTNRTRELALGPAERWSCTADVRPVNATDLRIWRGFQARMKQPGAAARVPAVEAGQTPNLIQNPELVNSADPWITGSGYARQRAAEATGLISPADWAFATTAAANEQFCVANGGVRAEIAPGQRLFLGAWIAFTGGTTGDVGLYAAFHDSGGALISPLVVLISPASGTLGQWRRVAGFVTAPAGSASVSLNISNGLTAGIQWVAGVRAALLPERAAVVGAANAGQTLALSGLALSARNLLAGDLITVPLPSGDEQLIPLTADLIADGSGNGTAQLGTPMRESPANGAVVELDRPTALMRALDPLAWSSRPGSIHDVRPLQLEEWF